MKYFVLFLVLPGHIPTQNLGKLLPPPRVKLPLFEHNEVKFKYQVHAGNSLFYIKVRG